MRLRFCFSCATEIEDEPQTDSRWSLSGVFLKAIHEHRQHIMMPPDQFYADNSVTKRYSPEDECIEMGLPHYVAYSRKLKNERELRSVVW